MQLKVAALIEGEVMDGAAAPMSRADNLPSAPVDNHLALQGVAMSSLKKLRTPA